MALESFEAIICTKHFGYASSPNFVWNYGEEVIYRPIINGTENILRPMKTE